VLVFHILAKNLRYQPPGKNRRTGKDWGQIQTLKAFASRQARQARGAIERECSFETHAIVFIRLSLSAIETTEAVAGFFN
jgi:hypothetical protein